MSKKQLIIYTIFLLLFLLLLADTFLFKTNGHTDKIDNFSNIVTTQQKYSSYTSTILFTKAGLKLQLPDGDGYGFSDTCNLIINRSVLFNIPVSVTITANEKAYHFNTTILNRGTSSKIIIALLTGLFVLALLQITIWKKRNQYALYVAIILTCCLFLDSFFRLSSLFIK